MTATDESDEHGFLPAVRDFPRGYGEASWWPFFGAVSATGLYVGASLYVLSMGQQPMVPRIAAYSVLGVSVVGFVASLFGWVYQAFASHFWSDTSHNQGRSLRLGMILFLCTDVATFGAGFTYYFFIRAGGWPPQHLPEGLLSIILAVNTVLLVASSFTFHHAENLLERGNHDGFVRWMAVTLLLGVVFVGGQIYEYREFLHEGFTITTGIFGSAFYGLTGLHGLHVSLGALLIGVVLYRALKGQYNAERHVSVTTVSWYWHFVDAVWLFLVTALYIGAELGSLGALL